MKTALRSLIAFVVIGCLVWIFAEYYSYIFSKKIYGEVMSVERLLNPSVAVVPTGQAIDQTYFSVAVAIKDQKTGEIVTGSSEDRQWAAVTHEVIQRGICAQVEYFPYPPWKLDKAGTYFGARLLKLEECGKKTP